MPDHIDHVIDIRMDQIDKLAKRRGKRSELSEEQFTRQLEIETERSLRASSGEWCPQRCTDEGGSPIRCDHGKPLKDDQRWAWITSRIGGGEKNEL